MRFSRYGRTLGLFALAVLLFTGVGVSQNLGNVYGVVSDDNGASLPGVTVTLEGVGAPRVTVTDENGNYRFPGLDPGTYYLKAELDGFSTVEQPNVVIAINRNTTINFTLSSAVEDVITVTSESPLLDERQLAKGANISQVELEKIPTARDPWSVMNQAPGVLVDRINVGGNESGQQSVFRGPGVAFSENDFLVDGVQITDMSATGASPTYYDFEQFEAVELSTGGPDVTKNAAGVSVNMVTRRGTNEFRGTARFLSAKGDGLGFLGQSQSSLSCSQLGPNQDCDTFETNSINSVSEYGFEAGGAAIVDQLWLWGSYGVNDIKQFNAGGGADDTLLENTSVKLNWQISSANSFLASWNNGDKKKFGRGAGPSRSTPTTWDQRGPSAIWKFEDTHVFSSNLYLTGTYSKTDLGFSLQPKGLPACGGITNCSISQEALQDSDGVWKSNFLNGFSRRPEEAIKLDGSYFFNTGNTSHELKFGGRLRESDGFSDFKWPGRNIFHLAGENFNAAPGPVDFFVLQRSPFEQFIGQEYFSLWAQDTIATGNWTINVGFRYDAQDGYIGPGDTGPSALPNIVPQIQFDSEIDPGFDWSDITPRIGVTYALGEDRDTLLRASFSQFPEPLGATDVDQLNPAGTAYAYFLFTDANNNNRWDGTGEAYSFLFGNGYDLKNPDTTLNTVASGYSAELTSEILLGVEHSFLPEFVVGLTYTIRNIDDIKDFRQYVRPKTASDRGTLEVGCSDPSAAAAAGSSCGDYDFESVVTGRTPLPNGDPSDSNRFNLNTGFEFNGFTEVLNGARQRDYNGLALTFNKRLANRWALRGFVNWGEAEWDVPAQYFQTSDPNDHQNSSDNDGALFIERSSGSGRGDIYLQSSWQWNLTGIYQLAPDRPWGFNLSANIYGREGYPIPYDTAIGSNPDGVTRNISTIAVGGNIDRWRTPEVTTIDLRAEKTFAATSNVNFTFGVDLFNALNESTTLAREPTLSGGTADNLQDLISAKIWKLSVRVSWK